MIGILIIAHGPLGESLIHSASHVMGGRPPLLDQLGIGMHDDPAALLPRARRLVNELDQGQGVLQQGGDGVVGFAGLRISGGMVMGQNLQ